MLCSQVRMSYLKCVSFVLVVGICSALKTYTRRYDDIHLDVVIHNRRLMNMYAKCILDDGYDYCTPDARTLKDIIPDALLNDCAKCTAKQKAGTEKVVLFLIQKRPDIWGPVEAKFDPTGSYRRKYETRLKEEGYALTGNPAILRAAASVLQKNQTRPKRTTY